MRKTPDERYLSFLPDHLKERYEEGLADSELLQLRREIALLDTYTTTLLEKLDRDVLSEGDVKERLLGNFSFLSDDEAGKIAAYVRGMLPDHFVDHSTFVSLEKYVDTYEINMARRNLRQAEGALSLLFRAIRSRRKEGDVWKDAQKAMESRRRLAGEERKRMEAMGRVVAVDIVVALLGHVIESLRESVTRYVIDEETQEYIILDAERLYNRYLAIEQDTGRDEESVDGRYTIE